MIILGLLFLLLVPVGIVFGLIALIRHFAKRNGDRTLEVRHVVVGILGVGLFAAAVNGVGWLLGLVVPSTEVIGADSSGEIAGALATTIVTAPAFYAIWRYLVRLHDSRELSESLVWSLFVATVNLIALVGLTISVAQFLVWVVAERSGETRSLGFALAYGIAWVWSWNLVSGPRRPRQWAFVPLILGSTYTLWVAAAAAIGVGELLVGSAYQRLFDSVINEPGVGNDLAIWLVWLLVGGGAWWWYWVRHGVRIEGSTLRKVHVLIAAILPAVVTALSAVGVIVYKILIWVLGQGDVRNAAHFEEVAAALVVLAVSLVVWAYHRSVATAEPLISSGDTGRTYRYLLSGVAIIAIGTGIGIVVAVVLGVFAPAVAQAGEQITALIAGITALIVGTPVWGRMWSPLQAQRSTEEIRSAPRRIYLTILAGVGGVVAVISSITFLYQVIDGLLDGETLPSIAEASRYSLGVLAATGIVAAYHYSIWKRERDLSGKSRPTPMADIKIVTLAAADGDELARTLEDAGAEVKRIYLAGSDDGTYDFESVTRSIREAQGDSFLVTLDGGRVQILRARSGDARARSEGPNECA